MSHCMLVLNVPFPHQMVGKGEIGVYMVVEAISCFRQICGEINNCWMLNVEEGITSVDAKKNLR